MELLSAFVSITSQKPIVSDSVVEPYSFPPFVQKESMTGKFKVYSETRDPTNPTTPVAVDSFDWIALTDGISTVYALGASLTVTNENELNFTLLVDSTALTAAFVAAAANFINAYLECRMIKDSQTFEVLREPISILQTAHP